MAKKAPVIRFKDFEDDWEQRKLGEISEKVMVKNTLKVFTETFTNSAEFGIISQVDFFDKQISNNINIQNYYVVSPNDFVYNPRISNRAPVGPIKRNKLGRTGVMSPLYYVFKFRELNSRFAEHYFNSYHWHKFMYQNGDSGARADRFAIKDSVFNKMPIPYPAIKEQEKVGILFELLENTLELHQRKIELLQQLKKGFLQKMFPNGKGKSPQIRFANFEGSWEHRKLGDVCSITTGKLDANAMVESGQYNFYTSGIKKYRIDTFAFEGPAITIAGNGATVGYMHLADGRFNAYQRTYVLNNFSVNREFLFTEIGKKLPKKINQEARTGNIPYIVMSMLTELNITIPNVEEQQKIGAIFHSFENNITLHQNELEKLEKIKSSFLQKMFI